MTLSRFVPRVCRMRPALLSCLFLAAACGGTVPPSNGSASHAPAAITVPLPMQLAVPATPAPAIKDAKAKEKAEKAAYAALIRANYTKYDVRIPMRDGKKLYTTFYIPKDRSQTYPILLTRTPYGVKPYGSDHYPNLDEPRTLRNFAPSKAMVRDGFIFVHQDVRGRMMSEGEFVDVRPVQTGKSGVDETTDAYDTVAWLLKNVPAHNGNVGVWGISYPGFYAAQAAISGHPAIKAVSPQAPVTDWFVGDDFHHNGAFFLADAFGFYSSFGKPRKELTRSWEWGFEYDAADGYEFFLRMGPLSNANALYLKGGIPFWNDLMKHGSLDAFWKARNPRPHYKNVKPAVMTVGGWFDAEDLFGALETYRAFETQSPGAKNTIVMGPWKHGGWSREAGDRHGDLTFGQKTSSFYQEQIELPFFRRHLKGAQGGTPPEALMFETGTNMWHRFPAWPPPGATRATFHFGPGGTLVRTKPNETDEAFDSYVSDPAKPVPYIGPPTLKIDKNYMTADQRFAATRPDVLVFSTDELTEDVRLAGPLEAQLWVSTTGTDADFIVKIIDVHPVNTSKGKPTKLSGYQQLVRGEVMRGKFRDSFETPKPFVPGQPTLVRFKLPDVCHSFRAGHRIMVQVQSSWFPLVDRNPQSVTDIYAANASDFKAATHRIHRSASMPSGVTVTLAP